MVLDTEKFAMTSPLGTEDIRLTPTPDKRSFAAVDYLLYELGYDSDGQHAPWKGSGGMEK